MLKQRLAYLDALRGFDMFWIVGGESLVRALAAWVNRPWTQYLAEQFEHVAWDGFRFYDFIFPLFLFIAGFTLPISLGKRLKRGEPRGRIYGHILFRMLLLVFLGILYNNGGVRFDLSEMRLPSVLGRIGVASGLAAIIVLNFKPRGQAVWAATLLIGYFLAMKFIPVPGHGSGDFSLSGNLASYIDRQFIPGRLYVNDIHDPEGLFSTIPAVATALLGSLTGWWMITKGKPGELYPWKRKSLGLLAAGLAGLALGLLWNRFFPINKNLWTSSFAVFSAGWSCLFVLASYLLVEVLGWRKLVLPFIVIGANSILVYFLSGTGLVDFGHIAQFFFGFSWEKMAGAALDLVFSIAALAVEILLLYLLYRRDVFIRAG